MIPASILLVILALLVASSLRILREYERGVVFQLGRFWRVKGPGMVILIPGVQQMVRIDLRIVVVDVPSQDVISRDNVTLKVNAVLYFRVVDAQRAVIQVENFLAATSQLAQTTLRTVLGKHTLDEMLSERERLNLDLQKILDSQTDAWGIKVTNVEIKHVDLNESMIRAIARQAEAERERRAKVIHAEGELQAAEKLAQAAEILARQPQAIQLRYLETLTVIAADKNSTIVFPLPMDIVAPLLESIKRGAPASARAAASAHPEVGLADVVVGAQLGGGPFAADVAMLQDVDPVGDAKRRLRVLLGHQDRRAAALDPLDDVEDLDLQTVGDSHRRFVEQQQRRPAHQRAPDRHHLLLAARQRAHDLLLAFAQDREQAIDLLQVGCHRGRIAPKVGAQHQVLQHRQLGEQSTALGAVADALADHRMRRQALQ